MNDTQRSEVGNAAANCSADRLFWAAALLVLVATACGDDSGGSGSDAGDAAVKMDGGASDAAPSDGSAGSDRDGASPDSGEGSVGPTREALSHPLLWQPVEAADDPFEDRPAQVSCPASAYGDESFGGTQRFVVDSASCDYITVSQPSRAPVTAGDEVEVTFSHYPLTAPFEDAGAVEAHLAFILGDALIAERRISIPASEKEYTVTWTASEDVDEGTPVYFHVHNHGENEYSVVSIEVVSRH